MDARFEAVLAQRRAAAVTEKATTKVAEAVSSRPNCSLREDSAQSDWARNAPQAMMVGGHLNAVGSALGMNVAGTAGAIGVRVLEVHFRQRMKSSNGRTAFRLARA